MSVGQLTLLEKPCWREVREEEKKDDDGGSTFDRLLYGMFGGAARSIAAALRERNRDLIAIASLRCEYLIK